MIRYSTSKEVLLKFWIDLATIPIRNLPALADQNLTTEIISATQTGFSALLDSISA